MKRIHPQDTFASAAIALPAVAALMFATSAQGQLLDDFDDGNDYGWYRFAIPEELPGASWQVDPETFVYRLSVNEARGLAPKGSCVASYLEITDDSSFWNGYWWATVVRETENSTTHLFMRGEFAPQNAYAFGWKHSDGLVIQRVAGGSGTILANDPDFVQEVDTEYILEAGAVASHLELRMWPVGEDRPDLPQLACTDPVYTWGASGIISQADSDGDLSSTFDDVCFIPICPADFDRDGDIDTSDLLTLLGFWGTPDGDVDGDGDTDTADLLALLGGWGGCP
jgi:hypothetical protein